MSGFVGKGRAEIVTADELTPFDDYRRDVLAAVEPLDTMEVRVGDALGLVLAEDVVATEPLPGFANSAMDGYALLAADVGDATVEEPVELEVVGEAAAGHVAGRAVERGTAIAVMTGGELPTGADAVVPVERTSSPRDGRVAVHVPAEPGDNIRPVGQDVAVGTTVIEQGVRIGPAHVGLLAALGHHLVAAVPSPRVVVVSTGDELVPSSRAPGPGQLRDSNGPMLRALVRAAGAEAFPAPLVGDDRRRLGRTLDEATGHADLIVTSGGVSAGAHDHLESVVGQLGEVAAHKVGMRPGMPQLLGRIHDTPLIGLPGNPVSSYVSFELFVRPAIRRLQGRRDLDRPRLRVLLDEPLTGPPDKQHYVRVTLRRRDGRWHARPTGSQGSHVLSSMAACDGLAIVPADVDRIEAGDTAVVIVLAEQ